MINFKELSQDGTDFELLMRDLLQRQGLEVYWSGKGPDGGKDLICIEKTTGLFRSAIKRWVVQCKHKAHSGNSVGLEDIVDIRGVCDANKASGYMLACTTQPSSSLITRFEDIEASCGISIAFWDGRKIERELMKPQNWDITEQYFPESARASGWRVNSLGPRFWHAMFGDNIIYMSARLGSNPDILLSEVERLLSCIETLTLPQDWIVRMRGVYFDDKNWVYNVYLDLLVPNKVEKADIEYFYQQVTKFEIIDGVMHQFDILLYYYIMYSDHFDKDHHDYYDPYLKVFEHGYSREELRNQYATAIGNTHEDDMLYTEEYVNGEFLKLVMIFHKLDFIGFINAHNARIELIDRFSEYFEWEELIEAYDYSVENLFEAVFRMECLDMSKLDILMKLIPNSVENHVDLRKHYIVLPGEGIEHDEDSVFTLGFRLLQVGIKNKRQYRRLLNQFLRDTREAIETGIKDGLLHTREGYPYNCFADGKKVL